MRKSTVLIIVGALVVAVAAPSWANPWDWETEWYDGPASAVRDPATGFFISTIDVTQTGYVEYVYVKLAGQTEAFTGDWAMGIRSPKGDVFYDGLQGSGMGEETWTLDMGVLMIDYFGPLTTPSEGTWAYIMEWPAGVDAQIDGWQLKIQGVNDPPYGTEDSPELATWLLLMGTGGVGAIARRRKRA